VESLLPLNLRGARSVPPQQLHLTLRFLGDVTETQLPRIDEALRQIAYPCFPLRIAGLGVFPNPKHPRVLWLGSGQNDALCELQSRIEAAVQSAGFPPESRAFTPHFTLARFKFSRAPEVEAFLAQQRGFDADTWEVSEFLLYSSTLQPQGALHEILRRYPALPSSR